MDIFLRLRKLFKQEIKFPCFRNNDINLWTHYVLGLFLQNTLEENAKVSIPNLLKTIKCTLTPLNIENIQFSQSTLSKVLKQVIILNKIMI